MTETGFGPGLSCWALLKNHRPNHRSAQPGDVSVVSVMRLGGSPGDGCQKRVETCLPTHPCLHVTPAEDIVRHSQTCVVLRAGAGPPVRDPRGSPSLRAHWPGIWVVVPLGRSPFYFLYVCFVRSVKKLYLNYLRLTETLQNSCSVWYVPRPPSGILHHRCIVIHHYIVKRWDSAGLPPCASPTRGPQVHATCAPAAQ